MATKKILKRASVITTIEAPCVSREEKAPSSSRNIAASETAELLPFKILDETSKTFPKFNATGRSLLIKFNFRGEQDPTTYFMEYITAVTNYVVKC